MSSRTAQQLPLASIPPTTGGGRSSDGAAVRTMRVTSSPSRAVRTAEAVVHPQRAEAVTASPGARHRLFHRDVGRLRVHDGARWTPDGQWRAEDRRAGWRGCQTRLPGPSPHAAPCDGLQTRQRRAGHPGDPALPGAQEHRPHDPLHEPCARSVQDLLAGLRERILAGARWRPPGGTKRTSRVIAAQPDAKLTAGPYSRSSLRPPTAPRSADAPEAVAQAGVD